MMARKKAEVVEELEEVELEELEDLTEVAEAEASVTEGMLTAKAAAALLGTDGRTLRKFLRKKYGILGQGKRWVVDPDEIETLRTEFKASTRAEKAAKKAEAKAAEVEDDEDFEEVEELTLDELEGPDEDELDDLEDFDFEDE